MISAIWTAFTKYRIALACAMIYFLHMGMMRISGLLVVASIDRYNVSREQATFPYILRGIVDHLSGNVLYWLLTNIIYFYNCCEFSYIYFFNAFFKQITVDICEMNVQIINCAFFYYLTCIYILCKRLQMEGFKLFHSK